MELIILRKYFGLEWEVNEMKETVLVLAPHTDDGEFGCGGTIARLLEEGHNVYYVAFSTCENSVPNGQPKDILKYELNEATSTLGIPKENVIVLNYQVRVFSEHRQNILDDMIKISNSIKPTLVFSPSIHDIHQDHQTIAAEAMRAFKKTTLLAYEVPWNNFVFENQMFYKLEKKHIDKKIQAIACYKSQSNRPYATTDFTISQSRYHGVQIGCEFAEVFELVRSIK